MTVNYISKVLEYLLIFLKHSQVCGENTSHGKLNLQSVVSPAWGENCGMVETSLIAYYMKVHLIRFITRIKK